MKVLKTAYFNTEADIIYLICKMFWLSFVQNNFCFNIINRSKKSVSPSRVITFFEKEAFQVCFNNLKITLLAQTQRLKYTLVEIFSSIFNKNPHSKVSHKNTPCYECIKRGGICQPQCKKRKGENNE